MLRRLGPLLVWVLLFGCNSNPLDNQALRNFAKTDTAFAVEAARNQVDTLMVKFLTKMYKRNPSQLPAGVSVDDRARQLTEKSPELSEINDIEGHSAVNLAFSPDFYGDRVFAFTMGLQTMVNTTFVKKREFLLLDSLPNPQYVFNAARNFETAAYLLRTKRRVDGSMVLLSDGIEGEVINTSFSRILGSIIGIHDVLAATLSKQDQRALNFVARGVASTVFLPVGL